MRMAGRHFVSVVQLVIVGVIAAAAPAGELTTMRVQVQTTYQTMDGFGASGAWWPNWVGDYPQDKQDRILDLLFTDKGIGLSIYRYNIPAGGGKEIQQPERVTAEIEVEPGKYDLSRDKKALNILRGVRQRGVERFVLFANSPPPRLTRNGMTSGGEKGGSNLRPGEEAAFARYLVDIATAVRREYDLSHTALSPINEPQWKWGEKWRGQEGCHYTPQEAAAVIRKVIDEVERRNAKLVIEAPESGAWLGSLDYADALFADPVIDRHLQDFAVHSYWTDSAARAKVAEAFHARYPRKRLVMSEYCHMKHGHDLGIDSALDMAAVIHDDLTTGGVLSWQWWLCVGGGGYQDALIYADPKTQKIEPTKRLWVLGQYSRFIKPGFKRVSVELSQQSVATTAFLSADGGRLVCVMINSGSSPVVLAPDPVGFRFSRAALYVTDAERDLAQQAVGRELTLPPRSVSTLVCDR